MDGATPQPPLTADQKQHWNLFIDYLEKQGYRGNSALDNKNMELGKNMLNRFNSVNPSNAITYNDISRIQSEMQQIRQQAIETYRKHPETFQGIKSENDIMNNLSPVDGWLGSKTSQHKFPTAMLATDRDGKKNTTDYGTDIAAYNKAKQ